MTRARCVILASVIALVPGRASCQLTASHSARFLAGSAVALAAHESGHVIFDLAFNARAHVKRVNFGAVPFFAIEHRDDLPDREEFIVSSAGFWVQAATDEWILGTHPHLRHENAPFLKGMLAFNVLTSVGYAAVAFDRAGPAERDTRSIAAGVHIDEQTVGALILAPAVLDAVRYYKPGARWAVWASRVVKIGSVALVAR